MYLEFEFFENYAKSIASNKKLVEECLAFGTLCKISLLTLIHVKVVVTMCSVTPVEIRVNFC